MSCGDGFDNGSFGGAARAGVAASFVESTPLVVAAAALTNVVNWTIPAEMLARNGDAIDILIGGTLLQSNAGAQTYFIGISLAGLALWGAVSTTYAVSANRRAHFHRFTLMRTGPILLPATGVGATVTAPQGGPAASLDADPAANWSVDQALVIAVQPSNATATWTRKAAIGTLLRAP